MRLHKIKASETAGTYLIESPVTEADILLMAKQLASQRLRRGRQLTAPQDVFNHLQTLLEAYEYEVFALLMLDGFYPISTDGLKRAENFRSCLATLRRILGL